MELAGVMISTRVKVLIHDLVLAHVMTVLVGILQTSYLSRCHDRCEQRSRKFCLYYAEYRDIFGTSNLQNRTFGVSCDE